MTYQQAHKYETGINRISAGRLYQIARALGVDISYFFEDVDPGNGAAARVQELMPQQRMRWNSPAISPRSRAASIRRRSAIWRAR